MRAVERLAQNLYISPPAIAQAAALGAFDGMEELEANRARLCRQPRAAARRAAARRASRNSRPPTAPSTSIATSAHMTNDAAAFAKAMLEEAGVAATPGVDFDAERGHRYLRFSYAGTTADMAEAARRLAGLGGRAPASLRSLVTDRNSVRRDAGDGSRAARRVSLPNSGAIP